MLSNDDLGIIICLGLLSRCEGAYDEKNIQKSWNDALNEESNYSVILPEPYYRIGCQA